MCGRTVLTLDKQQICQACSYIPKNGTSYKKPEWMDEHNDGKKYTPSYNITPTEVTPVLLSANKGVQGDRILKPMMWGIIPPWCKGNYSGHHLSTNNCRLENITTSKLYSPILRNGGRCVIVVEGFYEWKTTDNLAKVKQPYYIYMQQESDIRMDDLTTFKDDYGKQSVPSGGRVKLLYMAGLYQVWQNDGIIIYAYSIITMESNSSLSWLHHRMPAILDTQEKIERINRQIWYAELRHYFSSIFKDQFLCKKSSNFGAIAVRILAGMFPAAASVFIGIVGISEFHQKKMVRILGGTTCHSDHQDHDPLYDYNCSCFMEAWLNTEDVNADMAVSLLKPVVTITWHPVSTLVNNSKNKSADCIKRKVEKEVRPQKTLTAWFTTKTEKRKSREESLTNSKKSKP